MTDVLIKVMKQIVPADTQAPFRILEVGYVFFQFYDIFLTCSPPSQHTMKSKKTDCLFIQSWNRRYNEGSM